MVPSRQDLLATAGVLNIPFPRTCKALWVRTRVLPVRDGEMPSSLNTDINPIMKQMERHSQSWAASNDKSRGIFLAEG